MLDTLYHASALRFTPRLPHILHEKSPWALLDNYVKSKSLLTNIDRVSAWYICLYIDRSDEWPRVPSKSSESPDFEADWSHLKVR